MAAIGFFGSIRESAAHALTARQPRLCGWPIRLVNHGINCANPAKRIGVMPVTLFNTLAIKPFILPPGLPMVWARSAKPGNDQHFMHHRLPPSIYTTTLVDYKNEILASLNRLHVQKMRRIDHVYPML
jgi:hypothetical protein